jgi:predicted GNAT family acetyltransferase
MAIGSLTAHILGDEHREEVLDFLAARPLHTVIMASFIRDNGLESPLNRGTFYACRDRRGRLEAVALIGHATLVEARTEAAMHVCAHLAQGCLSAHVIMGEQEKMKSFWRHYGDAGQEPRVLCRELLFEQRRPVEAGEPVEGLRLATPDDLPLVMPLQAEMAFEESGVNPLEVDPRGFERRCARRIRQGRVWVWTEGERVMFKADIISATPQVFYLEGIHVHPEERGRGYGRRCLSQLGRTLLEQTNALCLLTNEQNHGAQLFYRQAGYLLRSYYDTIFLRQKTN